MSLPKQENSFNYLLDYANSGENSQQVDKDATSPSRRRRRRREPLADGGAASDEEPTTMVDGGSSSTLNEDLVISRTMSYDALSSIEATPAAGPLGASLASASALLGNEGRLERRGSPTLRMLSTADTPLKDDHQDGLHTMSARTPKRTQSELGPEAYNYAPNTAREVATAFPTARAMTPIQEGLTSPNPISLGVATSRRDVRPLPALNTASSLPDEQNFSDFLAAELAPGPSYPTTDVVWGQTERDRVYNALLAVPFQLERLLWLGTALCFNSFLSVFTLLPLRVAGAALTILSAAMRRPGRSKLRGDQLFDLLCAAMFCAVVGFLWQLKAGSIYFWVKELTQEFLKLSVLHTALELADKICCSFLVDVLEALAASCTALTAQPGWSMPHALNVASDATFALALLLAHGTVLMSQALVFGVAMNSQKNTLLALLIASNFTEIKGTVLKRFDPTKLFTLAGQDVIERFHLLIVLSFVLVEEAGGTGARAPSARLVSQCGYVLLAEMVIDVTKHAVLGKFNEIRPGVYREFTKDLCERVASAQSHSMHRLVGFEPFASAALFLRVALSYVALRRESKAVVAVGGPSGGLVWKVLAAGKWTIICLVAWGALAVFTAALGFAIKKGAMMYLRRYEAKRGRGRGGQVRARTVGFGNGSSPHAPSLGQPSSPLGVKKDM